MAKKKITSRVKRKPVRNYRSGRPNKTRTTFVALAIGDPSPGLKTLRVFLTFASAFKLASVLSGSSSLLFLLLTLTTLVEILDDDPDEHVEYEERDQQQE